jgi:pilus assembly protein CpaB
MRWMFGLVLIVGVALAGASVYMVRGYFSQTQEQLAQERELRAKTGPLVEIYVANKPLRYGDPLTKDDVATVFFQENSLPEGVFKKEPKEGDGVLFAEGVDAPRSLMRGVETFEVLVSSRITEPGEAAGMTGKLGPGMGAFTINLGTTARITGLQPEDRVDVYWTGTPPGMEGEVTRLIETTVEIISVDEERVLEGDTGPAEINAVTVAGTRGQVARLAQAQATGRLALSVVSRSAEAASGLVEVTGNSLLGIEAQVEVEEAPVVAERVCTIKTRKGGEIVETPIACTN